MKNSLIILLGSLLFCGLSMGQSRDYYNLDWGVFHSVNIAEEIDCQTDTWKNMSISEKNELCQIPEIELKTMTTKELIEAYLDCRYTRHLFLYSDIFVYYKKLMENFNGTRELFSRDDVVEEFLDYYSKMDVLDNSKSKAGLPIPVQVQFAEYFLGNSQFLEKLEDDQLKRAASLLKEKYYLKKDINLSAEYRGYLSPSNTYAMAKVTMLVGDQAKLQISKVKDADILLKAGRLPNNKIEHEIFDILNASFGM